MKQQNLQVGAYTRLSRDDDAFGESGSIVMQKEIIRQYCERNEMTIKTYYQDDGFTGTNYNRPDFQRMITDIESGKINCVITKDLSRLGRDYIMTGYYTEIYFPEHSVRYIAIGDNYDTQDRNNSNNDFAPFKFIVNDLYAKDISKKIRASKNAKFLNGEQLASHPPYGYKKDPNLKNHYVIDEETAPVVRKIFEMYANGMGRNAIVKYLRDHKILMPAAVLHVRGIRYFEQMEIEENRYRWSSGGLSNMFKNPAYIGDTAHYQYQKATNKSKVRKNKPENVLIIKGTHEPIIDMDTWNIVQRELKSHPDRTKVHENLFVGIAKCAGCGKSMNMNYVTNQRKKGIVRTYSLYCDTYKKYSKLECSCHYTNYKNLCRLVLESINSLISKMEMDEEKIMKRLRKLKNQGTAADDSTAKKTARKEKRLSEIARIYAKLYEDRALEVVSEENFRMLSDRLQDEQKKLRDELAAIKKRSEEFEKTEENIQSFVALIKSMKHVGELDRQIVQALIERIEIGESHTNADGVRNQQIDIFYKFIGKVDF